MRSVLVVALLAIPATASAHIKLLEPLARPTNNLGDPQKDQHCGAINSVRDPARVSTFLPGQTITVKFVETVAHTGWYRVSFQPDGQTFFIPPAGTGAGGFPDDATGSTHAPTGTMVLLDRIPDVGVNVETTAQVTLPDMECTNCTLQFIQVMTNGGIYDGEPDLYFNCADIVLAANAPDAGPQVTGDAGVDAPMGPGNNDSGMLSGGCSTGGGAGLPVALGLLGFVGLRRRRRA
jgi:uncharacterized protein (TIGR03382 family)